MRPASLFATAALLLLFTCLFGTSTACGDAEPVCNCPTYGVPQAVIALPCGTPALPLPTLTLSGVCAGTGGQEEGQLAFGSNEAGTCHVALTYANGETYSADVEFTGQWLACGSDPHGCGELIEPALPTPSDSVFPTLFVPPQCGEDGGLADAGSD
jgi:hypothetical protein